MVNVERMELDLENWGKLLATVIGGIIVFLVKYLKIPSATVQFIRGKKQKMGLKIGGLIHKELAKLNQQTGAIYYHIIKYSNGGPYKMTVEWEEIGHHCPNCISPCKNAQGIRPLQEDWQDERVTDVWAAVIGRTIDLKGRINTVKKDSSFFDQTFDKFHTKIWEDAGIHMIKEIILYHTSDKKTFTLCLSFCGRFVSQIPVDEYKIILSARKLTHLFERMYQ